MGSNSNSCGLSYQCYLIFIHELMFTFVVIQFNLAIKEALEGISEKTSMKRKRVYLDM